MTVQSLILKWINHHGNHFEFSSHNIEEDLKEYAKNFWNVTHNGQTYSREWRNIRSEDILSNFGLSIEEKKHGKEKRWRVYLSS